MFVRTLPVVLFSLLGAACQPVLMPVEDQAVDDGTARLDEGTPEPSAC